MILPGALGVDLRAGQPGIGADMRLPQAIRMMQAAEDGEVVAMLLQRLERAGKLVTAAGLGHLPGHPIDAVGDVDEDAAARLGAASDGARRKGVIASSSGKGHAAPDAAEKVAAGQEPALRKEIAHNDPLLSAQTVIASEKDR